MIEVVSTEEGFRAVDARKNSVEVVAEGWTPETVDASVPSPTDTHLTGTATTLRFPPAFVSVTRLDDDETFELGSETGPLELPSGDYLLRISGNVITYVRVRGAVTVAKPDYDATVLSFPEPTEVTVGFRSRVQSPPGTITVPRTPEGVATALTYLSASNRTSTPDRSFPTMRGHPPLVEFGEEANVPTFFQGEASDDLELLLPPRLDYLFPAASLSQYLGTTVTVEEGTTPRLRTPTRERELGNLPCFERKAADLLRRTFLLDCLVRNVGPYGTDLAEMRHLETLSLDPDELYRTTLAERLDAYLDAPFERVDDELPEWHLSMYVDPSYDHVEVLPYLLASLPNVFLARSDPLPGGERLSRSLDDFYRTSGDDTVAVDLVKPRLGPGRVHGWLAEGAPIDVFKSVPAAYPNQRKYGGRGEEQISVVAVLNDSEMVGEHGEAARIYRERATDLDLDIAVRERLSTAELARVFESSHDLVHYIGHCEESGLRCPDGNLSMSSLGESNAQTFFLNACGSFHEGVALVEKGSVAGGVTFNKVLDADAARVGTGFARLLMHGFCLERALDLARRRIMMGKDYTVVGDGTHVLTQSENFIPVTIRLQSRPDGLYDAEVEAFSSTKFGGYYQPHVASSDRSHLHGNSVQFTLDREELARVLERANAPVVYDGDLHWSESLANRL
ncbi:hypothetical protein ACFQE1_07300 [Halobium palmae]|uniref:CHAT domain-containing protein n=1 Tax=Halobium palmae TaxID=1776492 RepID=A0ABD5RZ24_9EURY